MCLKFRYVSICYYNVFRLTGDCLNGLVLPTSTSEVAKAVDEYHNACDVNSVAEEDLLKLVERFGIEVCIS
jgi:hypothetical protein